jgi:hypothetical protein
VLKEKANARCVTPTNLLSLSLSFYYFFSSIRSETVTNRVRTHTHRLELPERTMEITQYTFTREQCDRFGETYACTISISRKEKDLRAND